MDTIASLNLFLNKSENRRTTKRTQILGFRVTCRTEAINKIREHELPCIEYMVKIQFTLRPWATPTSKPTCYTSWNIAFFDCNFCCLILFLSTLYLHLNLGFGYKIVISCIACWLALCFSLCLDALHCFFIVQENISDLQEIQNTKDNLMSSISPT